MYMENRKRNHQIKFRLTDSEYKELMSMIELSGLSIQQYLLQSSLHPHLIDKSIIDEIKIVNQSIADLNGELNHIGNNFNQIAKHVNINGSLDQRQNLSYFRDILSEFMNDTKEIWNDVRKLIKEMK